MLLVMAQRPFLSCWIWLKFLSSNFHVSAFGFVSFHSVMFCSGFVFRSFDVCISVLTSCVRVCVRAPSSVSARVPSVTDPVRHF